MSAKTYPKRAELVPFVLLNRESAVGVGDAAVVDNALGGRIAGNSLIELGHARR